MQVHVMPWRSKHVMWGMLSSLDVSNRIQWLYGRFMKWLLPFDALSRETKLVRDVRKMWIFIRRISGGFHICRVNEFGAEGFVDKSSKPQTYQQKDWVPPISLEIFKSTPYKRLLSSKHKDRYFHIIERQCDFQLKLLLYYVLQWNVSIIIAKFFHINTFVTAQCMFID